MPCFALRRLARLHGLLPSALVLAACTFPLPVGEGDEDGMSVTGGSTPPSPASSSGPADTASGPLDGTTSPDPGTTDTGTSTNADTSTTDDTGDPPVGSVCDPQPEGSLLNVWLDLVEDEHADVLVDGSCEITGIEQGVGNSELTLLCDGTSILLRLVSFHAELALPLRVGQIVQVRAEHIVPIDGPQDIYLAISEPGGDLLFGVWSWYGLPRPLHMDWYAPVGLELVRDVCEPEPYLPPDNDGGNFIQIPCGIQDQRLAVDVQVGESLPQRVYDDTLASVEGYDVWVASAKHLYIIPELDSCTALEADTVTVLMIDNP